MKLDYATIVETYHKANDSGLIEQNDLPFGESLKISRLFDKLEKEFQHFEKKRYELLMKYAQMDDNGKIVKDDKGNAVFEDYDSFAKEYQDMLEVTVDSDIKPIEIDNKKMEERDVRISPKQTAWLIPFVKE